MAKREPGWYRDDTPHEGRMMFIGHDGEQIDPFVAFEEAASEQMGRLLEDVFAAGFAAGANTAGSLARVRVR